MRQTKVIDDESDYFSVDTNRWLSSQEKVELRKKQEELREKKHRSRHNKTITLDIAGRRVVEDDKHFGEWVWQLAQWVWLNKLG